jgi:pentatricopeptide repeat protein
MDAAKSMRLLKVIERSGAKLICTCCGVETLSVGNIGICSNCESMIDTDRKSLLSSNPELVGNLDAIRKAIANNDFESALSIYGRMRSEGEEPSLLYAEALACIGYSNRETSRISYDRKGFMEENASFRKKGSELASKAKLLMEKAIRLATDDIDKGNASMDIMYTLFLLQAKLGAMKGAYYMLHELDRVKGYTSEYANLVFNASMGRYNDVIKHADVMATGNQLPLNAFYYIAFALFKKGRITDSMKLLGELQQLTANPNVGLLLKEISETREV